MSKPIPDKAEVALDYPDKFYIGTFDRTSRFDAHIDPTGVSLTLERVGDLDTRKSVRVHMNHGLFAEILQELARTAAAMRPDDVDHRAALAEAARDLHRALAAGHGAPRARKPQLAEAK